MSKKEKKIEVEAEATTVETVNVDKAIENTKTSGTNLQAYIRAIIRER